MDNVSIVCVSIYNILAYPKMGKIENCYWIKFVHYMTLHFRVFLPNSSFDFSLFLPVAFITVEARTLHKNEIFH